MAALVDQAQLIDGHGAMQVPVVGGRDFANQRRMVVVETTAARRPVLAGSALQIDAGRNGVCLVVRSHSSKCWLLGGYTGRGLFGGSSVPSTSKTLKNVVCVALANGVLYNCGF